MITILQIVSNVKRNGPAAVVLDLTTNLPEGYRAVVASGGGEQTELFVDEGVACYEIPINRQKNPIKYLFNILKTIIIINKIIKREKVDLIHCHQPFPILFGRFFSFFKNLPLITTAHNIYDPKSFFEKQYSHGSLVAAVSEKVRQDQIINFKQSPDKIVTIRNCIDPRRKKVDIDRLKMRQILGVPSDCFLIVTLAGLRKQKALDVLIKAAEIVTQKHSFVKFAIVGRGEEEEKLKALIFELGLEESVFLPGFRTDVYNVLNASDLFCLSSDYEGLPISILEAMICSLPIVSTEVGGVNEIVVDGETGYLCPKGDYNELANKICKIIESPDLYKKMSDSALKVIQTTFQAELMAKRYCALYDSLLEKT